MSVVVIKERLAKIAEINPPLRQTLPEDESVSFLPMAAVEADRLDAVERETRLFGNVRKGYTAFEQGDVLVAKITPCFENGKIAQAKITRPLGFGSTEFHVVRARPKLLDSRYLVHFLRQEKIRMDGQRRMTGSAGQRRVPEQFLSGLEVPLPPLPEQRRIATILDKVDAIRAKRREALAQLDRLTQSIFIEMFGDPSDTTVRFSTYRLDELVEGGFQNGAYFPKESYAEDGVEMVHMSDAFGGVIKRGGLKRVRCSASDLEKYSLTADDLIVARRSLIYDGAARPCRVPKSGEPLIFESSFIRVRVDKKRVTTQFLFQYLNNSRVREKFVRPYVTQSTISGINQSNLSKVPVIVPPVMLQNEFNNRVEDVEANARRQCESSAELDSLFASLQHRAFRGEL